MDHYDGGDYYITSEEAKEQNFDITWWFAKIKAKSYGLQVSGIHNQKRWKENPTQPQNEWADALAWHLETGVSQYHKQNCCWRNNSPARFIVTPVTSGNAFLVRDRKYAGYQATIPLTALQSLNFFPCDWYRKGFMQSLNHQMENYFGEEYSSCLADWDEEELGGGPPIDLVNNMIDTGRDNEDEDIINYEGPFKTGTQTSGGHSPTQWTGVSDVD
ncbi:hypothetical protein P691DRAFT_791957 [Macrolepiota fuliginosa MF-IS2]|uniref:Uncharacterized protein n=1 Tax=Macrolepiota fuliginosa MF-IS2 TaxID=1400762 RepID=A0A9P6BWX9_9AGAR|nr:hypothetical protein P691DRAFT_791957 [Macrolepiota fuliginosa MF-IS2]